MRITKEKRQENHDNIVAIASELFREKGFDGIGVADLMKQAGLTHGGFYNHFVSKDALINEAAEKGFIETSERYAQHDLEGIIDAYISREHRDARGQGCPAAALSCDAARQQGETKNVFGEGIEGLVAKLESGLSATRPLDSNSRALAISLLAQAVGAIILSRSCPDKSAIADEILEACRRNCHAMIADMK